VTSAVIADHTVTATDIDSGTVLTTTAANFTTPAVGANVSVTVTDGTKVSSGSVIQIAGAGYYQALSIAGNVVTAQNLSGYPANAPSGTVINSGANVSTQNAIVGSLGYVPVSRTGDPSMAGMFVDTLDTVVGSSAPSTAGYQVGTTTANMANDGYFPAIGFRRGTNNSRALGLDINNKFKTVDQGGTVGFLLDTIMGVDTASIQDKAVTLAKLSDALVALIIAPGTIHIFAGPSPPTGWLVCDGTHYLQNQYAVLYTAIGGYYGQGGSGASAWFAVPDLRGRVPLGYVNSAVGGITGRTFGSIGGEEAHVLIGGELAAHNHGINDPQHNHALVEGSGHTHAGSYLVGGQTGFLTGSGGTPMGYINQTGLGVTGASITNSPTNIIIQNAGGNQGHNNMQPFTVMYYIIKT